MKALLSQLLTKLHCTFGIHEYEVVDESSGQRVIRCRVCGHWEITY